MSGTNPTPFPLEMPQPLMGTAVPQVAAGGTGYSMSAMAAEAAERLYRRARFRALRLLWRHLNKPQRAQYRASGQQSLVAIGNATGAFYELYIHGDTLRLNDQHRFCLVMVGECVPPEDALLARKLLIEHNERLFLATANDLSEPIQRQLDPVMEQLAVLRAAQRRGPPPPYGPPPPPSMGRRGRAFRNRIRQW